MSRAQYVVLDARKPGEQSTHKSRAASCKACREYCGFDRVYLSDSFETDVRAKNDERTNTAWVVYGSVKERNSDTGGEFGVWIVRVE